MNQAPNEADQAPEPLPSLRCLDGRTADPELVAAMGDLASLPQRAFEHLPEMLATRLDALSDDQRDARLARLCRKEELDLQHTRPAVVALASVFRAAAATNVAPLPIRARRRL